MLRVYGRANSINVRKVLWMLDEIGIKYQREDWGHERLGQRPGYRAHGRNGTP